MKPWGAAVAAMTLLVLAGCTGSPAPVVTQVLTEAPTQAAEVTSPSPSPSPSFTPEATTPGNLFTSGVGFNVSATKTADSSTDAAGNPVSYDAINVTDGDPSTAWRKANDDWSYSDYILVTFDEPVQLTQVGLIPGYAKIDPDSGTDRFIQNHRLRVVNWLFSDGTSWRQELEDEPTTQTIPVAGTVTWVRLTEFFWRWDEEPAATRDYVAISDVSLIGKPAY